MLCRQYLCQDGKIWGRGKSELSEGKWGPHPLPFQINCCPLEGSAPSCPHPHYAAAFHSDSLVSCLLLFIFEKLFLLIRVKSVKSVKSPLDEKRMLVFTVASDGSLKAWNFNIGDVSSVISIYFHFLFTAMIIETVFCM